MKKFLAGILAIFLSIQVCSGMNVANAVEADGEEVRALETDDSKEDGSDILEEDSAGEDESVNTELYPEEWDEEDPLNGRAYKQLYGSVEEMSLFASPRTSSASATTWNSFTYTHNDSNIKNKIICVGIDVSYHQNNIDWKKVKASGIEFAIIRVGYRAYASGSMWPDSKFVNYITDAQNAELKVGVYFYSQAINEEEAIQEADFVIEKICDYDLDLPVAFDYEYASSPFTGQLTGRLYDAHLSKVQKTNNAIAFCNRIENAGYSAMVYANSNWCYAEWDTAAIREKYAVWMARYNSYSYNDRYDSDKALYGGQIDFWQCTESAKVDGISVNVDLDYWYMDDDEVNTKKAWVRQKADGNWYYCVGDKIDYTYTGVAQNENGWWRIEDGKVNFEYEGVEQNENGWWYLKNGKVDFTHTGVEQNENGWWRIENGKVNFEYEGVAQNKNGWWYLKNGKVDFTHTGVEQNENGWWRIEDGKVNFEYEGVAQNKNGWWYLKNGKVDFTHTGVEQNENGWWRIEQGKVNFNYNGIAQNKNGWWYIRGGKVIFTYTGWVTVRSGRYWVLCGKVDR